MCFVIPMKQSRPKRSTAPITAGCSYPPARPSTSTSNTSDTSATPDNSSREACSGDCEADFSQLTEWFGGLVPQHLPFRVSIVRGSFGAFHDTCVDTHLHCAAFDGHNAELVEMLTMAEAVEVFSAAQNAGWDCGASNGEALSPRPRHRVTPHATRRIRDSRRLAQLTTHELRRPQRPNRPQPSLDRLRSPLPQLPTPSARAPLDDDRRTRPTDSRRHLPRAPEPRRRLGTVLHTPRRALPTRPIRTRNNRQRLPTLTFRPAESTKGVPERAAPEQRARGIPDRRLWAHRDGAIRGAASRRAARCDRRVLCPTCFSLISAVDASSVGSPAQNGTGREQPVTNNTEVSRCVTETLTFGLCGTTVTTRSAPTRHNFRHKPAGK